ncbi:MAG: GntR family transcriptional regulator [Acidimicrobiales bacterium]
MADPGSGPGTGMGSAERAYELIRAAVIEGRYRSGQRLVEQRIGEEFALSRTPVREALRMLEAEGLVVSRRNRGAVVRPVTARDVTDLYELRARLEALAAERSAARATGEDLAAMDLAVEEFDAAALPGDGTLAGDDGLDGVRALHRANARFHDAVLRSADHPRLSQLMARTVDIPLVFRAFQVFTPAERERSNLFHRLIRTAIAAGEADRAGRLMAEHVLQGRDSLLDRIAAAPLARSIVAEVAEVAEVGQDGGEHPATADRRLPAVASGARQVVG